MMGAADHATKNASGRALDALVPRNHLLRRVDSLLDMSEVREALDPYYSRRGRPSVPPELLVRMALIGRLYGITSERRLCEEVRYNLAYRWFCRLPLGSSVPHHSTFSKNRHGRFREAGIFRILFEQTVRRCAQAGLIACKDAAVDASFVAADASWQRKMREDDIGEVRRSRPVREWLADQACAPKQVRGVPRGKPAQLSRTDPAAGWSPRPIMGRFGYSFNVLIDTPGGVAVDAEATPARFAAEVDAGRTMVERSGARFGYKPKRLAADKAYGSADFLSFLVERGTLPHIPVIDRREQTGGMFTRERFRFEESTNSYICPAGKVLRFRGYDRRLGYLTFHARAADCQACRLKTMCTSARARTLSHSEFEDVRRLSLDEIDKPMFKRSMKLRQGVERVFADAKSKRGLTRLHLRGLRGAEEEILLAATVNNLVLLARPARQAAKVRVVSRRSNVPSRASRTSRTPIEPVPACSSC